ncbi:MAG: nitroreductase family protein [Lachnospiraceae bacterium]|nr:nitroreductase family protein [Lachnospiraceae bacterium]
MEFEQVLKGRFSVRNYQDRPIEDEKLSKIIKAGLIAPTACNYQPQRIYVLKSEEALAKIRGITRCAFNAPVVFVLALNEEEEWHNPLQEGITSGQQDVAIAATQMMLEAWNLGLGSCWVCYFPNGEVDKAFGFPEHVKSVMLLPVGYAAEDAVPAKGHMEKRPAGELLKVL